MKKLLLLLLATSVFSGFSQDYCTPSFQSGSITRQVLQIRQFEFNEEGAPNTFYHSNSFKGENGYLDFTIDKGFQGYFNPGESYPVSIEIWDTDVYTDAKVAAFFDWDGDGTFEDSQANFISYPAATNSGTGTITVPTNVSANFVRVRFVLKHDLGLLNNDDPCEQGEIGDARDYIFQVKSNQTTVYAGLDIVKNSNPIYSHVRGDAMVLGFNLKTLGGAENLKLISAEFEGAPGTDQFNDIESIKLIHTGAHATPFSTRDIVNSTFRVSTGLILTTNTSLEYLLPGDNWFWVMVRLKENLNPNTVIDLNLKELIVSNNGAEQTYKGFTNPDGGRSISNTNYCVSDWLSNPDFTRRRNTAIIDSVKFGSLQFSHKEYPLVKTDHAYNSFTNLIGAVDLCYGSENKLEVKASESALGLVTGTLQAMAYFDWNQDGNFNGNNETYYLGSLEITPANNYKKLVAQITPPPTAKPGYSIFRIHTDCGTSTNRACQVSCGEQQEFSYFLHKPGELAFTEDYITTPGIFTTGVSKFSESDIKIETSENLSDWNVIKSVSESSTIEIAGLDTTTFFRISEENEKCPSGVAFSPTYNLPFVGIKTREATAVSCQDDSTEIGALYEYEAQEFISLEAATVYEENGYQFPARIPVEVSGVADNFVTHTSLDSVCFTIAASGNTFFAEAFIIPPHTNEEIVLRLGPSLGFNPDTVVGAQELPARYCFVSNGHPIDDTKINPRGIYTFNQGLERLNNIDPNGTWTLLVGYSRSPGQDEATVSDFKMSFGINDNFHWTPGLFTTDSTATETHAKPEASSVFSAAISNLHGTFTDETLVVVPESEVFEVTILDENTTNCEGAPLEFEAQVSHQVTGQSLQWFINDEAVSGATSPTFSNLFQKNDVLKVVYTVNTTCGNFEDEDALTLDVQESLNPLLQLQGEQQFPSCEGIALSFEADTLNFGANASLQWSVNNALVQSGGTTYNSSTIANGDIIGLEVISNHPCVVERVKNQTLTAAVTERVLPSVMVAATETEICDGETAIFTVVNTTHPGSSPDFQWQLNNENIPGEKADVLEINGIHSTDIVSILMESSELCISQEEVRSNETDVQVNPTPTAAFDFEPNSLVFSFTPQEQGLSTYNWNFGDGNTSNVQSPSHEFANEGSYEVCLLGTNTFGCAATRCENISATSIFMHTSTIPLQAFPNPTKSAVQLIHNAVRDLSTVTVLSSTGRAILVDYVVDDNKLRLDFTTLASGTYYVVLQTKHTQLRSVITKH